MSLTTLGGKLLRYGNRLALSAACCCRRFCRQTREDECGNPVYECVQQEAGSIGACVPDCKPPETPCECGPDKPCAECFECIERKCERIEDCCTTDEECGPCQRCENNVCVPCGECEQCVDGECVPCGPCQVCVDGECVPCPEACVDGVCVPNQYHCCYDWCPGGEDSNGEDLPEPSTHCQPYPCGYGEDENGEDCSLTKSGPYATVNLCNQNCQKYECVPDACGNRECVPDPDGPYNSMSECLQSCPEDPCASPCSFAGASSPGVYSIDACERDICVSYVSPDGRPIRVQIWGPTLDEDCNVIASRVIKADSAWRCLECCDCPNTPPRSNDSRDCQGGPVGQVTWNKPRGVTSFEVVVLTACGSSANIDIQSCQDCTEYTEDDVEPCECSTANDCNQEAECQCCDGKCKPQDEPCGCENPCDPDCELQEPPSEMGPGVPECFLFPSVWKTSGVPFSNSPNVNFQWKPGYPAKITGNGCTYFWHIAQSRTTGTLTHPSYSCCGRVKFKWTLLMCDGTELRDITDEAVTVTCQDQPVEVDDGEGGTFTQYPECSACLQPGFAGYGGCLEGEYCFGIGFGFCNASCLNDCVGCNAPAPDSDGIFDPPTLNCDGGPP